MSYVRRIRIENYRNVHDFDVDLSPGPGQVFRHLILTGPNGSGKTSALELIEGSIPRYGRRPDDNGLCTITFNVVPDGRRPDGSLITYFRAQRLLVPSTVTGPIAIDWQRLMQESSAANLAAQLILNRKYEQLLARDQRDTTTDATIDTWLADLQRNLAHLLEDPRLQFQFDRTFALRLRYGDEREVTLDQLAQGHSAALYIFFELLIQAYARRETFKIPLERLQGIVLIDEIETHLHLRLQELILPFLTTAFPTFQFIVATHSPAVIASVPDAVVYDLGRREAVDSEDLQGVRYGTLMTHHFGIAADMDHDSTEKLERLRTLSTRPRSPAEETELADLAGLLRERSSTLALEVWKLLNPAPRGAA